jgi:hypothetical protein
VDSSVADEAVSSAASVSAVSVAVEDVFVGDDVDEDLVVEEESPADAEEESLGGGDESDGSAYAMPGVVAMATPTPSVTANAPTRPMCLAYPMTVPLVHPHRVRRRSSTAGAIACRR